MNNYGEAKGVADLFRTIQNFQYAMVTYIVFGIVLIKYQVCDYRELCKLQAF